MEISKTELYELIERQADKLVQLEITKAKAKDGYLLDSAIENSLREAGLASVVEELNEKNDVVAEKIQKFIDKEEKVLFGLTDKLKFDKTVKSKSGAKKNGK
jgi:hypothetical protein